MRVLLIAPKNNYYEPSPRVNIFGQGLPYIAASLKQADHHVAGINFSYQWCGLSAKSKLQELLIKAIGEHQPDLIGVGGLSAEYVCIRDAIALSRKYAPHTPVVLGGNILTYDRQYVFNALRPDYGISGEAEGTITQLTEYLTGARPLEQIANLSHWVDGKPVHHSLNHPNASLDDMPYPDYDIFNYRRLQEQFTQTDIFYGYVKQRPRVLPISLARSCPSHCTFCIHKIGARYRTRSIDSAIAEIKHFYHKYEFNLLFLYDELFSLSGDRILEFCRKITDLKEKERMNFLWTCDLRVDNTDRVPLRAMKESGCAFIGYGIESGSQRVLDSMKKKITVQQIAHTIDLTNQAGIGIQGNLILGDPAETLDTIRETVEFYNQHCSDLMISMGHIVPYPGSEIFAYCEKHGIIKNKAKYYARSGQYPIVAQFNMTKIPDRVWYKTIHDIEQWLDGRVIKSKEARLITCLPTGEFADATYPPEMRRQYHLVTVACPHCDEYVVYLVPLGNVRVPIRTACVECNKLFIIRPPGIKVARRYTWEAKAWGHLPPAVRLAAFNLIWRGIQLKAFVKNWLAVRHAK